MKTLYMKTLYMKTFFISSICFSQQIHTLSYIKQFEINKANYIGKPFSVLLNDMTKIKPKTVWFTPLREKNIIKTSRFKFTSKEYSFGNAITLLITWKDFIPYRDVKYLYQKNDFYGEKIIQDISVYR